MKSLVDWRVLIAYAANKKFPNNTTWTQQRRIQSIYEQLDDVRDALAVELGLIESGDHAHKNPDHRICALIADILILAEMRDTDLESEMQRVLDWFRNC